MKSNRTNFNSGVKPSIAYMGSASSSSAGSSVGLKLGVLGLTAGLMLMGCSDRHRDAGNVVTPTDATVAESTDRLPAGMPATSIDQNESTSGSTTAADTDAANSAATSTTQTEKTTTKKIARHNHKKNHRNKAARHHTARHRAARVKEAPVAVAPAPAPAMNEGIDAGSTSGSTSSANSDMSGSSSTRYDGFINAPGRSASALTDQGVQVRFNDARAASTL